MSDEKKNTGEQLKIDSEPAKNLENPLDDKKLSKDELDAVAGGGINSFDHDGRKNKCGRG